MKIFITGVAGFLGSHLADRMLELGHDVIGVDNLVGGNLENLDEKVDFYNYDCDDLDKMVELTKNCEIVIHAACTAHEGLSNFAPYYISKNTFQITMSVLSAAVQNKVKRFVFCSSMARYGQQDIIPFTEDMICKPVDPYGASKIAAECAIKQICELNNIEYVVAVPHNIIGPKQCYTDPFRNVASIMINRMLQNKQPIIYGNGEQVRCFSFISDVIECFEKIVTQDNVIGEIINIGPDEEFVTINKLATILAELLDFELDPIYMPGRPNEVFYATCSSNKARRLLGYETKTDLKAGLCEMVKYIQKNGTKEFEYKYNIEIINELTPRTWTEKLI